MAQFSKIEISIEQEKLEKIYKIVKELYDSGSINSNRMNEFIDFTLFIVIDEYDKNFQSLKKFYNSNLEKYLESKKDENK